MFNAYRFQRDTAARNDDRHDEGQAFVLTSGAIQFRARSRTWIMIPGRLCWVPPDAAHGFVSSGPVAGLSVKVSGALCTDLPDSARVLDADLFHTALLQRMIDRPEDQAAIWPLLARSITHDPADRLFVPAPRDRRLTRIAESLTLFPADDRDLAAWAKTVGMSPRSLMRRFQSETGLSFAIWRRTLRLLLAVEMMQAGKPATEAALACGFGGSSAFSAAFRKHMGVSPTAYLQSRV